MTINKFLKDSLKLIDSEDVNRELSNCNYKFTEELLKKDIEIAQEDNKIAYIKKDNLELSEKNTALKSKLKQMLDSLS